VLILKAQVLEYHYKKIKKIKNGEIICFKRFTGATRASGGGSPILRLLISRRLDQISTEGYLG
jgi:hypothetical protein